MFKVLLSAFGMSAALLLGAATPAGAQCCAGCNCGAGYVIGTIVVPGPRSYLVDQGPVYSGPGHYVEQEAAPPPRKFPYVGFVFSGYPYGYHDAYVGAPRRFYHPY
jgi:hypothetical protein